MRLKLRYQLLRGVERCGDHMQQWYREDPLKHGRFRLKRSNSIGAGTAEEVFERRTKQEPWAGFVDVFDEFRRPGVPALPETADAVPPRGLVDEFEAQGVFRQHTEELTNKDLFCTNPWTDTTCGARMSRAKRFITRAQPPPPSPWELEFDEALAPYAADDEGEGGSARGRRSQKRPSMLPMDA